MTTNRSSEELAMRELIVPKLRARWPGARIIHELPLRYSSNRIDLAAVTETQIISVEIKSSHDVIDRLEAQLRGFLPISARLIVALAPKWNEKLAPIITKTPTCTSYRFQRTQTQEIIERVGNRAIEVWTVDAAGGTIDVTDSGSYRGRAVRPYEMLHLLHVEELVEIATKHRCWSGKRPRHFDLVEACTDLMTGREVKKAVCAALRARDAFAEGTDAPIGAAA